VQGVFFRETVRRRAQAFGSPAPFATARTAPSRRSSRASARRSSDWSSPAAKARVDWIDVESEEPNGLTGFEIS